MPPLIRRTGLLDRRVNQRDARLFFIITEDTYAAPQYFLALQERGLINRSRVKIKVLPTQDTRSAPSALLQRSDEERARVTGLLDEDEFWIVFDVDHHRSGELANFNTLARQKKHNLAGCNPCFELWLILHETDDVSRVTTYDQDSGAAEACTGELRRLLGKYNKNRIDTDRYTRAMMDAAIQRATRMDTGADWPATVGTHVHRLVGRLPPPG